MEEKNAKNDSGEIRSVSTLAGRIREPRLSRMYNRESELFDELALTSRKALKSLIALQRDNEKLNAAEKELQQEIKELQRDVKANTAKNFEKAKRSKEAHKSSDAAEGEV